MPLELSWNQLESSSTPLKFEVLYYGLQLVTKHLKKKILKQNIAQNCFIFNTPLKLSPSLIFTTKNKIKNLMFTITSKVDFSPVIHTFTRLFSKDIM